MIRALSRQPGRSRVVCCDRWAANQYLMTDFDGGCDWGGVTAVQETYCQEGSRTCS